MRQACIAPDGEPKWNEAEPPSAERCASPENPPEICDAAEPADLVAGEPDRGKARMELQSLAEYKREIAQNKEDATRHALEIAQNKTEIAQHKEEMRALRVEMSELRLAGIGEGGSRKHRAADNASSSQLARVADDN